MDQIDVLPAMDEPELYKHSKFKAADQDRKERAMLSSLQKRVKAAYDAPEAVSNRKQWKKARLYATGKQHSDGGDGLVRVNLIHSHLAAIQPQIYAKSPEIGVTPIEGLEGVELERARKFAETLERVLQKEFVNDCKLKKRGKTAVRAALTTTRGWAKIGYQREYGEDPLIKNRINDAQDNIARIKHLLSESQEPGEDQQAALYELELQVKALEAQVEVQISEGLCLDILPADDVFILDEGIKEIDELENAGAIAHRVLMPKDEFETLFGIECDAEAAQYTKGDNERQQKAVESGDEMVCVWEVWDRTSQTVYTFAQGGKSWCREPYQPAHMGQRWFPFFPLQFNRIDGVLTPPSMVDMLQELQDEYNERRTNAAEHRRKNIPVRILNKTSGISDQEVTKINNRSIGTNIIAVTADPNVPLQNQLGSLPEIPYNPQMYDPSDILRDMEMTSGASDASRGSINKAKTATEAEIMSMGLQSRSGETLDVVEDWLTDMATFAAQMLLQELTPEQASEIIGAEAFWPQLDKESVFRLVNINIRAGSTAKPNKIKEREQWGQLLPTLLQLVQNIAMAEAQGQAGLAQAFRKLGEETLKRYDENMLFEELMPQQEPQGIPVQAAQGLPSEQIPIQIQ